MNGTRIDPRVFRDTLGNFASGIAVITGLEGETPVGFTCQSFYSVSLSPPLVSFCVSRNSESWPRIRPGGAFVVNLLGAGQIPLSNGFARSGVDRWAGVDWHPGPDGLPRLGGAIATIGCRLHEEHVAGDHLIVLGEVLGLEAAGAGTVPDPLIYFRGQYRILAAG